MWTASLKRHHESLAGRMHDCEGHLERTAVQSVQDFKADAGSGFQIGTLPGNRCVCCRLEQGIKIDRWIRGGGFNPIGRALRIHPAGDAGLIDLEVSAKARLPRGHAVLLGILAVDPSARHFGIGRPIPTGLARRDGGLEGCTMCFKPIA